MRRGKSSYYHTFLIIGIQILGTQLHILHPEDWFLLRIQVFLDQENKEKPRIFPIWPRALVWPICLCVGMWPFQSRFPSRDRRGWVPRPLYLCSKSSVPSPCFPFFLPLSFTHPSISAGRLSSIFYGAVQGLFFPLNACPHPSQAYSAWKEAIGSWP